MEIGEKIGLATIVNFKETDSGEGLIVLATMTGRYAVWTVRGTIYSHGFFTGDFDRALSEYEGRS